MIWTHKKYAKRIFKGSYAKAKGSRERMFYLVAQDDKANGIKAFESWQMAKSLGWVAK